MRIATRMVLGALSILTISGCRVSTQVKAVPRVDLAVENQSGNRGYITGTPPPYTPLKTTRQMLETSILIPGYAKTTDKPNPVKADKQGLAEYPAIESSAFKTPEEYDTYVVKKGDSLWSIAANPDIYGKATRWRNIYDANRDTLKSPDSVKAGMEIKIPRSDTAGIGTTYDDEGSVFKK